jgi:hypothetical protein
MAYVVRATHPEHGDRYKVFRALPDARDLFELGSGLVLRNEREAAYLYEVPGEDDARAAVEAVKVDNALILDKFTTDELKLL